MVSLTLWMKPHSSEFNQQVGQPEWEGLAQFIMHAMLPCLVHSVVFASVLMSAVMILMTPTQLFVCVSCVDRGVLVTPNPTLRAVKTHICKSPVCQAAGLGVKEVELEARPTVAIVGCVGAAGPAPNLRHTNRPIHVFSVMI